MIKLSRYLKNYKKEVFFGQFCKFLEAIFELIVPLVMADIIDNGIPYGRTSFIVGRGFIMIALGVLGLGFSLTCQYLASKCSQGVGTELRNDFFKHANSLSYEQLDKFGAPSLVNRMTGDIDQIQVAVAMLIRLVVRAPFLVIGAIIISMTINLKLSLVFLIITPILSLVLYMIMKFTIPRYKKMQKRLDKISLITRENLTGVRDVRAFTEQDREQARFEKSNEEFCTAGIMVNKISSLLNPFTYALINVAILAILYFGGNLVNTGDMTQGEIIAFVNYLTQIMLALVVVANLVILYTRSAASASRINEVFALQSTITDEGNTAVDTDINAPVIEFNNVTFAYYSTPVLSDLSFKINRGETVGIIGSTGSGKSTLINLIPRFYDTNEGEVKINGTNVKSYPLKQLRDLVGLVPQNPMLFSGTIRENMQWGNENATDEEIYQALDTAQANFVKEKQGQLDFVVNQGGKNFSGGQKQRLTIARALVKKPQILILDDSSSALDYQTDKNLRSALRNNCKDMTTVMISQRASSIKHCDLILVLEKGKLVGMGKHEDLAKNCEVYIEICNSQDRSAEKEGNNEK